MMLYRDEVYNPESQAKGIAEINVTKQRNGELGTIYRRFYNGHFLPTDQELAKQRFCATAENSNQTIRKR